MTKGIPYILCAAIWYKESETPRHSCRNITKGAVMCGHRHSNIIAQCSALLNKRQAEMGPYVQGFLTSDNQFVDRTQAAKIAWANKQTKKELPYLYSEDLY